MRGLNCSWNRSVLGGQQETLRAHQGSSGTATLPKCLLPRTVAFRTTPKLTGFKRIREHGANAFPKYLRIQDDHETAFPHILTRFDMIPSLARSRGVPRIVSSRWFARTKNGPCCFWLLFTCGRLQNPIARDRTRELELVGCDNYPQTALSAPPPGWNVAYLHAQGRRALLSHVMICGDLGCLTRI